MKIYLSIATIFLLTACSSYTIPKESFVSQLQQNQSVEREHNASSVGIGYDSNGIEKIKCIDKNGNEVWLYGGKNINFKIAKLSGGSATMYFDTVYIKNDTVYGLVSRIVGGKRKIALTDIATIKINAEEAKTKPVN
jgi:hypothetical protein